MHSLTDTSPNTSLAGAWAVDPATSSVAFAIKHLHVATVHGRFEAFDGMVRFGDDLAGGVAEGSVEIRSVRTGDGKRDEILRGAEFFDASEFPAMTFRSVALRPVGDRAFLLDGDLELRGVTRRITLDGELGRPARDPEGRETLGIWAQVTLDRTRFGMPFDDNPSSALLGKKVKVSVSLTTRRVEPGKEG
jgi:polyisoprenoid-binding protein YceI